jgi:hypothetical protein
MGTRGRRSTAEMMVVKGPLAAIIKRPDPPRDLNVAEAAEWRALVATMPPGYFARTQYVGLAQLCKLTVGLPEIDRRIAACCKKGKSNNREYVQLTAARLKQTLVINVLQRSMRLTHQAVLNHTATKKLRPAHATVHTNGSSESPWGRASA